MTITPIDELDDRLPQAGRIRTGEQVKGRSGKMQPQKLDHFRFTSGDRGLIDWCAQTYGGIVQPFDAVGSGDKWMVDSPASQLDVFVAGYTLAYERWDPHLDRRCNGRTCEVLTQTPDDSGYRKVDCICRAKGLDDDTRECSKILRLPVMLDAPDVPTLGSWRLDTRSENSIKEIRGFFRLLEHAGAGPHRATMQLIERRQPTPRGQPNKKFNVIILDYKGGFESLLAGDSRLVQLPTTPAQAALGVGPPTATPTKAGEPEGNGEVGEARVPPFPEPAPTSSTTDDEIVDAELVDDDLVAWVADLSPKQRNQLLPAARKLAIEMGEPVPTTFDTISDKVAERLMEEAKSDA